MVTIVVISSRIERTTAKLLKRISLSYYSICIVNAVRTIATVDFCKKKRRCFS